jgi:hypothetical protein
MTNKIKFSFKDSRLLAFQDERWRTLGNAGKRASFPFAIAQLVQTRALETVKRAKKEAFELSFRQFGRKKKKKKKNNLQKLKR